MATFRPANKKQQKLRLGITGLAGSGKTYSALRIASGMGEKIAVIDSEHSSSELYASKFAFDLCALDTFSIEEYVDAIVSAGNLGYDVIIIDSLSHAWEKLLERVDMIADQRYRGNTFRAWAEGGELQKKLVEAMLSSPCHIIATIRTKAEYAVNNDNGKTQITKLGTAPKQREGLEYELSLVMEMSQKHTGFISKDRTGKFQDKYIELPGEDFGKDLIAWLNEGDIPDEPQPKAPDNPGETLQKSREEMVKQYRVHDAELKNLLESCYEDGANIFAESEVAGVKASLASLKGKNPQECIEEILKLIATAKATIEKRLSASKEEPMSFVKGFEDRLAKKENPEPPFEDDIPEITEEEELSGDELPIF
ncbi:MAG: ATP-binding protein [Treponema sp.]|nr:ATP-binding protein [Treponema sp.]